MSWPYLEENPERPDEEALHKHSVALASIDSLLSTYIHCGIQNTDDTS